MGSFKIFITKNKEIFLSQKKLGSELILEYYITVVLLLYPLFMSDDKILLIFKQKYFLYYILTIGSTLLCIWLYGQKKQTEKIHLYQFDILLLLSFVLLVIRAVVKIFQNDMTYEQEIFLWGLIVSYFLLKTIGRREKNYLNMLLLASIPVGLESVNYILSGREEFLDISSMLENREGTVSFFLLASCTTSVLYCNEKRDRWRKVYLIMAAFSYFVIFVHNDMMSICLTGFFLLSIPIAFSPTVSLVKRNLILCFIFLFLLSNMSLLQYVDGISLGNPFDLKYSVYIDFFIAFAGVLICKYWDKIPKDVEPDCILMKKFQKWYRRTLTVVIALLAVYFLIGSRLEGIPEQFGIEAWKIFGVSLQNSIYASKSANQKFLENYGFLGLILWIFLTALIMEKILKKWKQADNLRKIYFSLSVLFLVQSFFYQIQSISTPAFVILLALALSEKREEGIADLSGNIHV